MEPGCTAHMGPILIHAASWVLASSTSADPEGGRDRGSGPPLENYKLYGFL